MSTFIVNDVSSTARRPIASFLGCTLGFIAPLNAVHAEVKWAGSLALTSDYIQQGLSQTQGKPAVQGGLRAQIDQRWTVGAWASSIDRYDWQDARTEIDVYAARTWRLSPDWITSLTATHYFYPDDASYVSYDYDEVTASLGYRSTVFATVAWSPNYSDASDRGYAHDRSTLSYELSANQPLLAGWSGNVGVGYRDLSELFGEQYWYGHAGLMHSSDRLTVHLTYTYADPTARELFGHDRAAITWLGTVIWRFGNQH
ncbi:TorF family putative porin [Steroidobacter cummioxidans]|uniref:TorF family putative porin n=1 Tax=Steroidobacter cummioxidans TaxID=1803913 RepID=UPI00137AE409|nr:TorF family putative porin [Steroidobacter cummioxidans]